MVDLTKVGSRMNPVTKQRLLEVYMSPIHDGLNHKQIAELAGVSEKTVYRYSTPELLQEARQERLKMLAKSLVLVDRALFEKASKGDVQAAKIIYSRFDTLDKVEHDKSLSMAELDNQINQIEEQIKKLENGELTESQETAD